MNKPKVLGIAVLVTLALLVIATGAVFAIGLTQGGPQFYTGEENDENGQYWGPMHGRRGGWSSDAPPMHAAMVEAVAEATGLSVDEIEARIISGEHLYEIALDAGLEEGEFFELMTETRKAYLAEAFEEGWISEERYQWMLERMEGDSYSPGYGGCHRYDGEGSPAGNRGTGMGRGRRW